MTVSIYEDLWGSAKRLRFIDAHLTRVSARSVLDIGCGTGRGVSIPLAAAGYTVTGVDPHGPSIETGRSLSSAVSFVHGTLLDVHARRFDAVILSEVLEHLEDPERLLAQAVARVAPRGVLIVTVPNGYGPFECDQRFVAKLHLTPVLESASAWVRAALGRESRPVSAGSEDTSPHIQRFTLRRLGRLFAAQRLTIVERAATTFASGPLVAYTIGRVPGFVRINVSLADRLPLVCVSGWMFALSPAADRHPHIGATQ